MRHLNALNDLDIILASQSPRRQMLLTQMGLQFRVAVRPINEDFPGSYSPEQVVQHLAFSKSTQFEAELKKDGVVVITADTIVVHRGQIVNKPSDQEDAFQMLTSLSGSTHEVYTGVCIRRKGWKRVFTDRSLVTFMPLEPDEINYYIEKYPPYDKAGGYGIQDWIGCVGIESIQGSYHNVMGLPVHRVYAVLKEMTSH